MTPKYDPKYRSTPLEVFEGCEHLWVDKPGPMTDNALEMVKAFIARNLSVLRRAT